MNKKQICEELQKKYANDALGFVNKHPLGGQGIEASGWQLKLFQSDARRIAIPSSRGSGKTMSLSAYCLFWATTKPKSVVNITSSTYKQLMRIFQREVKRQINACVLRHLFDTSNSMQFRCANGSEINFIPWSKDRTSGASGEHSKNVLCIADEASDLGEGIWEAFLGCLQDSGSRLIASANPVRIDTLFFTYCTMANTTWEVINVNAFDCPWVPADWIEDKKNTYGEDSDRYKMEVLGLFPDQQFDGIFNLDKLRICSRTPYKPLGLKRCGIDCAEEGDDDTVMTIVDEGGIVLQNRYHAKDWDDIIPEIARICTQLDVISIAVDATGVGYGFHKMLVKYLDGRIACRAVKMGEKANSPQYMNIRAELPCLLAEWIYDRSIQNGDCRKLLEEAAVFRKTYVRGGVIKLDFKAEMKKQLRRSPDTMDSLCLCMAAGTKRKEKPTKTGFRPVIF